MGMDMWIKLVVPHTRWLGRAVKNELIATACGESSAGVDSVSTVPTNPGAHSLWVGSAVGWNPNRWLGVTCGGGAKLRDKKGTHRRATSGV